MRPEMLGGVSKGLEGYSSGGNICQGKNRVRKVRCGGGDVHLRVFAHIRDRSNGNTKVTDGTPEICSQAVSPLVTTPNTIPLCPLFRLIFRTVPIAAHIPPGPTRTHRKRVRTGRADVVGVLVGADFRIEGFDCGGHGGRVVRRGERTGW